MEVEKGTASDLSFVVGHQGGALHARSLVLLRLQLATTESFPQASSETTLAFRPEVAEALIRSLQDSIAALRRAN